VGKVFNGLLAVLLCRKQLVFKIKRLAEVAFMEIKMIVGFYLRALEIVLLLPGDGMAYWGP